MSKIPWRSAGAPILRNIRVEVVHSHQGCAPKGVNEFSTLLVESVVAQSRKAVDGRDAARGQAFDLPAHKEKVGRGQGRHGDPRLGELLAERLELVRSRGRQVGYMTDRNAAFVSSPHWAMTSGRSDPSKATTL
jgi:hypothetical protein